MRQGLLDRINRFSEKLTSASHWIGSGTAFGHIDSKTADDYVFEFYCYISILYDLSYNQNIQFVRGTRSSLCLFPKKPASKAQGWARFDVWDRKLNQRLYQVCAGTKIQLSCCPTTMISPDISFQNDNSPENDHPTEDDIVMVMDSKFKTKADDGLGLDSINEFIGIVTAFKIADRPSNVPLSFDILQAFKNNCLITNGKVASKHSTYCTSAGIRQIGKFGTLEHLEVAG